MNNGPTIVKLVLLYFGFQLAWSEAAAQEPTLDILHINVGQGDATLILGPADLSGDRVIVLFDAGGLPGMSGRDGGAEVLEALGEVGVDHVDFFVASHYDADHIGGVVTGTATHGASFLVGADGVPGNAGDDDGDGTVDWLEGAKINPDPEELGQGDDAPVGTFIDRGDEDPPSSQTYQKYVGMAEAVSQRISLTTRQEVEAFEIGLGGGATMTALAANGFVRDRPQKVPNVNTENEKSLCFLIQYGGFDYLLCGDLIGRTAGAENARVEEAVGQYLDANGIEVDALHVNHHGANNASDGTFLTLIQPEVAVISLGNDNGFAHPNRSTLTRLAAANVQQIFQTGWGTTTGTMPASVRRIQSIAQGDIWLRTDGQSYQIIVNQEFDVDE